MWGGKGRSGYMNTNYIACINNLCLIFLDLTPSTLATDLGLSIRTSISEYVRLVTWISFTDPLEWARAELVDLNEGPRHNSGGDPQGLPM